MICNKDINSPITGSKNVKEVLSIPRQYIINKYLSEFGVSTAHFFKDIDNVTLYECNDTGYKFYYPFDLAGDGEFYTELKKGMNIDYYPSDKEEFLYAIEEIADGQKVLDIGCGDGYFLEKISKRCNVKGIELNDKATQLCREKGLDVEQIDVESFANKHEEEFDVVTFFQVLEHINDVKAFIEQSLKLLKKGGKLIIAVPDNSPFIMGYKVLDITNMPPHHMGMWNNYVFKRMEDYFTMKLRKTYYSKRASVIHYMFYLSSYWLFNFTPISISSNIVVKSLFSIITSPLTLPTILYKIACDKIKGHTIICIFEKNNN